MRIAVRDMAQNAQHQPESQIYHWGIKKDTALGDGRPGNIPSSTDASSAMPDASLDGESRGPKVASSSVSSDVSNASLDGAGRGTSRIPSGVSSDTSNLIIPTSSEKSNGDNDVLD